MKELLQKRKAGFVRYIIACFIPVINHHLSNIAIALLIGSIEIGSMDYFFKMILISFGIVLFGAISYIVSRFMRIAYMRDVILDVRLEAFNKILKSSFKNFNQKSKESYISNLINDINIFENNFFLKLINVIFRGGVFITSIIILAIMDYKFGIGILLTSITLFFLIKSFEKRTIFLQEQVSNYNEEFAIDISNTFNGLEILKLNRIEDKFLHKSLKSIFRLEKKKLEYNVYTDGQRRLMDFIGYIVLVGTLVYLLNLIQIGVSVTKITLMFQISNGCIWHITSILPLFNELKSSAKIYEKITGNSKEDENRIQGQSPFSFENEIIVNNLYFDYEGKEIFKGINLHIEKGKKYLLKGASGAGKSTLIKLLSMVYDDYRGEILVDRVDLKDISETSFNDNVSFIYQDVFLFEDNIRNNITLFKDYGEDEILKTSEKAGLKTFLGNNENGLDGILMENGKNLSGGERQRISIARAILKKSSILFVDEGTSSLDEELGRKIEDTILSIDSTVIAISHRYYPGITEKYDYVIEIKDGVIEQYDSSDYFKEVAFI